MRLEINGRMITKIIIDPHFEEKHSKGVSDEIILMLAEALDGQEFEPEAVSNEGFEYYATEPLYFAGKPYRLVWLLHRHEIFLGVINCFRRRYGKK